jgi:poly(A) polymerase
MEAFALPPSKRIGDLRQLCEAAIERGELEERRDAGYYLDYLRKTVGGPG